ncbi:relaxase/mobilization nuclease domain-containing protein [Riemerella anatipestifer]|uniref:relaxase/mobilization nuclease domain-containing protein n=1 Tax=Riemerella anatipestifer TaxID=34085 RepID=UPI0021D5F823|nr:relaxase/mobilization nuclease domain-containing protein [Riemerella anatipestifer]MCU7571124.1 relaxase/mobilization nuclease domain-containing protein [Riemerella anatipestifer]MDY3400717.1 relaxase/mobilization nuclease domain-containing protein [Riemerella anatipestifer]
MIVKILSASKSFSGVEYNDKKVEKGKGELMAMKNFPSFINEESGPQIVKDYLKSISKSNKVKKPQFHAVISTKFQEHSKEELKIVAENFMQEMGYGEQPYIAVFHNDTDNNHIHIVSTRIDKASGKKLNDSFERLKSQKALQKVMDKLYPEQKLNEELDKLLNYKYSSLNQLKELLERNGFKLSRNSEDDNRLDILKNGVLQRSLTGNQLSFNTSEDKNRKKQIAAVIKKYSEIFSNKTFKVIDDRKQKDLYERETNAQPKIEWESELQKKLRDMFGIDIIFHHKEKQTPFGYTVIDNRSKSIFKGSEILKMREIFQFTDEQIDKKNFEVLKDFNITTEKEKEILREWYNKKHPHAPIQIHMLFYNKNKNSEIRKQGREDVLNLIKSGKDKSDKIDVVNVEGKYYAIHNLFHQVWEMGKLIGEIQYQKLMDRKDVEQYGDDNVIEGIVDWSTDLLEGTSDIIDSILKPNYGAEIEDEFDPRKKKRKKR